MGSQVPIVLIFLILAVYATATQIELSSLAIDSRYVVAAGHDHAGSFAHQFHVAFSSMVSGSCIFTGQPFYCAVSHFNQDDRVGLEPLTPTTRVPFCDGCPDNRTLPFDHCVRTPDVVDVGSSVDYPRRHCGQNPINIPECFDDVDFLKSSKVFLFRGSHDEIYAPGAVKNIAALMAQMIDNPATSVKFVGDQPFNHILPLKSTPHHGAVQAAGYDGPGECLRHVFDGPVYEGTAISSNWHVFDQTEFADSRDGAVGFQERGWIYIPKTCTVTSGSNFICRLLIRPDKCDPPNMRAPDVDAFADYAEQNGIVLLHPCVGGAVDKNKYPHAPDIESGKMDVYGQLCTDVSKCAGYYVQQSGPHMRIIGKMVRRVLGITGASFSTQKRVRAREGVTRSTPKIVTYGRILKEKGIIPMPTLKIDRGPGGVATAGCSNTGDFAAQFLVAFSSIVKGGCLFSSMPYHCAVTRFTEDYMVPKSPSTSAGIHCPDCDEDGTLIYDHCKNHPHWVELDKLWNYTENAADVDDPWVGLKDARVFSFGPTRDRCYQPPAMENIANFHLRYVENASQVLLVEDQPFPHTLPGNNTPHFNHSEPAGYDGPGECVKHVFGKGKRLYPSDPNSRNHVQYWLRINASEFVPDLGIGSGPSAWLFVPPQCKEGTCKLLILPGGANSFEDDPPSGGSDDDFARYGYANGINILKPDNSGGPIDPTRFPLNHENLRGMIDVYGQLSESYATQKGDQMAPLGRMLKRLMGLDQL